MFGRSRSPALWLILLNLALYLPVLCQGYLSDDFHLIRHTTSLRDVSQVLTFGFFRPLVRLTIYIEHICFGNQPAFSHLVNLLLHIACVLLVYKLALRLLHSQTQAFACAMFFSVWYVQAEVISWVSARSDSLALVFVLAFMLNVVAKRPLVAALCFALALLSKETALVYLFPAAFLCWQRTGTRQRARCLALHVAVALCYLTAYLLLVYPRRATLVLFKLEQVPTSLVHYLSFLFGPGTLGLLATTVLVLGVTGLLLAKQYRALLFALAFAIPSLALHACTMQIFYRFRYLYGTVFSLSIMASGLVHMMRIIPAHRFTRAKTSCLAALLAVFFACQWYLSAQVQADFKAYAQVYRSLARAIPRQHEGPVIIKDPPPQLGATRLLFLMPMDAIWYYTGREYTVMPWNHKLARRLFSTARCGRPVVLQYLKGKGFARSPTFTSHVAAFIADIRDPARSFAYPGHPRGIQVTQTNEHTASITFNHGLPPGLVAAGATPLHTDCLSLPAGKGDVLYVFCHTPAYFSSRQHCLELATTPGWQVRFHADDLAPWLTNRPKGSKKHKM